MAEELNDNLRSEYRLRMGDLMVEHRDLDLAIHRLQEQALRDELALKRMKKRKLLLKDQIAWLQRQLDPDIPA
jgi:hypothetical protein